MTNCLFGRVPYSLIRSPSCYILALHILPPLSVLLPYIMADGSIISDDQLRHAAEIAIAQHGLQASLSDTVSAVLAQLGYTTEVDKSLKKRAKAVVKSIAIARTAALPAAPSQPPAPSPSPAPAPSSHGSDSGDDASPPATTASVAAAYDALGEVPTVELMDPAVLLGGRPSGDAAPAAAAAAAAANRSSKPAKSKGRGPRYAVPDFAAFLGRPTSSIAAALKDVWEYVKKHDLPKVRKGVWQCDDTLRDALGVKTFTAPKLMAYISARLPYADEVIWAAPESAAADPAPAAKKPASSVAVKKLLPGRGSDSDNSDSDAAPAHASRKPAGKVHVIPPKQAGQKRSRSGGKRAPGGQLQLSPQLSAVCGGATHATRPQVVKMLWEYIRGHELQDPAKKSTILCDDTFAAAMNGKRTVTMFSMNKEISSHLFPVDD